MSQPGPPQPPQPPVPTDASGASGQPYGHPAAEPPVYAHPAYAQPVAPAVVTPGMSPFAIVSLVAGAASGLMLLNGGFPFNFLGAFGAVIAVVFGHVSLVTIARRRPTALSRGLGIAGLVLGYLGIGSILVWIGIVAFVLVGLSGAAG
jgi:hypothetical protein